MSNSIISEQQREMLKLGQNNTIAVAGATEKSRLKRLADRGLVKRTRVVDAVHYYYTTELGMRLYNENC